MTFTDADNMALYDETNAWDEHPSGAFYDGLVDAADDVLDVGCGTGQMLINARLRGHAGRLVGLDPDVPSLERARSRTDAAWPVGIEWVEGKAEDARWDGEFDLAVMASNAFQCFVTDDDLRKSLRAIRTALRPGGLFAFDTRYPPAREWETWHGARYPVRDLEISYDVQKVENSVVTFTESTSRDGEVLRVDRGVLRFLEVEELNRFLNDAGFVVDGQYGDWVRGPITAKSKSIVTVAANQS